MECCVDGSHNWHAKFLLGSNSAKVLSDKATGMKEISNYLMGAFKDTIGLRVFVRFLTGQFGLNSI
jgi:hypothetical protein